MEQHDLSKIQKLQEKGKSDKIIKYLSSSDDTVVVAALEALSQIKDEDSVNSIAHMIDNPDAKIRIEAAKALGSIGTEYAKTYLLHIKSPWSRRVQRGFAAFLFPARACGLPCA